MSKTKEINTANQMLCCAFCKHWYDPTFAHVRPTNDKSLKWWEYDMDVKSLCDYKRKQIPSQVICGHFEKKELL